MTLFRLVAPADYEQVIDYLHQPDVFSSAQNDYPKHTEWIQKTKRELENGDRTALVAALGNAVVGAVIFLANHDTSSAVAVRHFSVHPDYRKQRIGTGMLGALEDIANKIYPNAKEIVIDTKETNHAMVGFLESKGYSPKEIVDLYQSGKPDVVLAKLLPPQDAAADLQPNADRSIR